jgi:hypothetical protein
MSPRVKPKTISQEIDDAFEREVDAEATLIRSAGTLQSAKERRRIALRDVNPYGAASPHSWVLDRAAVTLPTGNAAAKERLNRFEASREARAITTTALGGLVPSTIPPWVAEAVAYGYAAAHRSLSPLSASTSRQSE